MVQTHTNGAGGDANPNQQDINNAVLGEFDSIETNSHTAPGISAIQESMRVAINSVLLQAKVTESGGNDGLHNPRGDKYVQVREGLDFAKFKETLKAMLDQDVSNIKSDVQARIYTVLHMHRDDLRTAAQSGLAAPGAAPAGGVAVAAAPNVAAAAPAVAAQAQATAPSVVPAEKKWLQWLDTASGKTADFGVNSAKALWWGAWRHLNVFGDYWAKNPKNWKDK